VGCRGKTVEHQRARELRAESWTVQEIADELGVARSSVSIWVRDVVFEPKPRQRPVFRNPSSLHLKKLAEIESADAWARTCVEALCEDAFFAAGIALHAGEGSRADRTVKFANTDPLMVSFFCRWLRKYFRVDESRLRVAVYLHDGLDLDAAESHWSRLTGIPRQQFRAAYRAKADTSIRTAKHIHGCCYVVYSCSSTHRRIMGLVRALLS
jgi:transcriptional regulator with XRE-family HTH domain